MRKPQVSSLRQEALQSSIYFFRKDYGNKLFHNIPFINELITSLWLYMVSSVGHHNEFVFLSLLTEQMRSAPGFKHCSGMNENSLIVSGTIQEVWPFWMKYITGDKLCNFKCTSQVQLLSSFCLPIWIFNSQLCLQHLVHPCAAMLPALIKID